jgi:ubiquinone/menaquinone biosynthesis C-methylase UbiE
MIRNLLLGLGAWTAFTYALEVLDKPKRVARKARRAARRRGKPLLNVGCGHPTSSLRAALFGKTDWGDVNCDLAEPPGCRRERGKWFCHCDAHDLPFSDKRFGAAISTHVLEHVDDPKQALQELHRVADEVFVVTPTWAATHTWLHPGHQWYRDEITGEFLPLYRRRKPGAGGTP